MFGGVIGMLLDARTGHARTAFSGARRSVSSGNSGSALSTHPASSKDSAVSQMRFTMELPSREFPSVSKVNKESMRTGKVDAIRAAAEIDGRQSAG